MTAQNPEPVEVVEELEGGFSRRALGWIVGSVAASLLATVLLAVCGRDLDRRANVGANTFSYSALGHRALVELLRSLGMGVRSRQLPAGGIGPRWPLILAEPEVDTVRLGALRDEAKSRGAIELVVLPKWQPREGRRDRPEWLEKVALRDPGEILGAASAVGAFTVNGWALERRAGRLRCSAAWESGGPPVSFAVDLQPAQLLTGLADDVEPLVTCAGAVLVARRQATAADPAFIFVADPDLLNNHGLGRAENASLTYQLLIRGLGAEGVVFDETLHGFNRTPGLLAEALRFPMLLGVLQSLVLLGIVLWAGMGRFGKPVPASAALAAGKEILIDNTAKLLAGGGHAADGLSRYFRQITRAAAAHYFLPFDLSDGERLDRLQRIADARRVKLGLAELERSIGRLAGGTRGEEQAATIARQLHDWRVEMMDGNR